MKTVWSTAFGIATSAEVTESAMAAQTKSDRFTTIATVGAKLKMLGLGLKAVVLWTGVPAHPFGLAKSSPAKAMGTSQ